MLDLKALVIEKRLSCPDDCSYQVRLKRYREQRQNLGELNRLASFKPRPVLKVEEVEQRVEQIEEEEEDVPILKTDYPWRGHDDWFRKLEEEELSSSDDSSQDEWFELSKKRMFEGDTGYIKRLKTADLERERQANYDNWEADHEQFMKDWREDAERAEKQRSRKSIRDALNEYTQLKERRIGQQDRSNIHGSLAEYRERRIRQMEEDIASYRQYRKTTSNDNSVIREAMDEYYGQMRDDIGTLEELR